MSKRTWWILMLLPVIAAGMARGESIINESETQHVINNIRSAYVAGEITVDEKALNLYYVITGQPGIDQRFISPEAELYVHSATPLLVEIRQDWDRLSAGVREMLVPLFFRPDNSSSAWHWGDDVTISVLSNTQFKVHYLDSSDSLNIGNTSACTQSFAQGILDAAETSRNHQVNSLGYLAPLVDADHSSLYGTDPALWGGDEKVDIYIYRGSWYGAAVPEVNPEECYWAGFFIVNPDFLDDAKQTTAHEYFHLIQFNYDADQGLFWMEATATWMEGDVFPDINDYVVRSVNDFLANPTTSLDAPGHEYNACIWPIFLENYIGKALIRTIWEEASPRGGGSGTCGNDTWPAHERALASMSYDFRETFQQFITKNYNKHFYPDGARYEDVHIDQAFTFSTANRSTGEQTVFIDHLASRYFKFTGDASLPENTTLLVESRGLPSADKRAVVVVKKGATYDERVLGLSSVIINNFEDVDEVVLVLGNASRTQDNTEFKYEAKIVGGTIAYILDRSGSMAGTPLSNAKLAANQGITTMREGDEVAVVSFSSAASVNYSLSRITDDSVRQAARAAVNSLSASGWTSIGAGLLVACDQLSSSSSTTRDYVLLSDGMQNTPPTPEQALASQCFQGLNSIAFAQSTTSQPASLHRVHTIAFGTGADQQALAWIASQTGGTFLFVPTRNDPLALADLFLTIQGEINQEQRLGSFEGTITAPALHTVPFAVGADILEERITLIWDNAARNLDLEIERPDGTVITAANVGSYPNVSFVAGPAIEYFSLSDPEPGDWTAHVKAISGTANYALVLTAQSSIQMNIFFDKPEYPIGGNILVSASLVEAGEPITGASVTAQVMLPTAAAFKLIQDVIEPQYLGEENSTGELGISLSKIDRSYVDQEGNVLFSVVDIILYDDGAHGDGVADDGIYANYFTDTNVMGTYTFKVAASGQAPSGVSFTREASKATFVSLTANHPPVADAGIDQTVECVSFSGSEVTLDGSGSYDPDGDPLNYTWKKDGHIIAGPMSDPQAIVSLGLGTHTIQLVVQDSHGATDTDEVIIAVVDTTPPEITVSLNRYVLWPPNHKMVDIYVTLTVTDMCCENPIAVLDTIYSNEPDRGRGSGNTANDIQEADYGTSDTAFKLRAERSGLGDGRIYTIVYTAEDCSGNKATATAEVRVPHSQAGRAYASAGYSPSGTEFNPAVDYFVIIIPSKAAQYEVDDHGNKVLVAKFFDATKLDVAKIYVGNTAGTITPLRYLKLDNDKDGLVDLALFYCQESAGELGAGSDTSQGSQETAQGDGPVGLHYTCADGIDYVVWNVLELGPAVPLNLRADVVWDREHPSLMNMQDSDEQVSRTRYATTLLPSYPNPFNPLTTIPFTLAQQELVVLRVYDASGKLVRILVNGRMPAGRHDIVWDGRDKSGNQVVTGIYFIRLSAGSIETTKKAVMIR